jgi:hypothetical protein
MSRKTLFIFRDEQRYKSNCRGFRYVTEPNLDIVGSGFCRDDDISCFQSRIADSIEAGYEIRIINQREWDRYPVSENDIPDLLEILEEENIMAILKKGWKK